MRKIQQLLSPIMDSHKKNMKIHIINTNLTSNNRK